MPNNLKAIIFDVDGTLADTERYAHFPACNDAMAKLELPFQWDWTTYLGLFHSIVGNANRLRSFLEKQGYEPETIEAYANRFIPLKQSIYINKYLPKVALRKGVKSIMHQIVDRGLEMAIVSSSHESQIRALLQAQFAEFLPHLKHVFGKESGQKTENDGFLHKKCLKALGLPPKEVLVIEDAPDGLKAALYAGLPTAVFYNEYTFGCDFPGAKLVAPGIHHFDLDMLEAICFEE